MLNCEHEVTLNVSNKNSVSAGPDFTTHEYMIANKKVQNTIISITEKKTKGRIRPYPDGRRSDRIRAHLAKMPFEPARSPSRHAWIQ